MILNLNVIYYPLKVIIVRCSYSSVFQHVINEPFVYLL